MCCVHLSAWELRASAWLLGELSHSAVCGLLHSIQSCRRRTLSKLLPMPRRPEFLQGSDLHLAHRYFSWAGTLPLAGGAGFAASLGAISCQDSS